MGSYKNPRELLWIIGMFIYLALMAEAFMGYLLPWGQMSDWGAQVIVNLFGAIPYIGPDIALWIRGDYVISDATLGRFFAFHVIAVPLMLVALVFLHIVALHQVGSNNSRRCRDQRQARGDTRGRHSIPSILHGQRYRRRCHLLADILSIRIFLARRRWLHT